MWAECNGPGNHINKEYWLEREKRTRENGAKEEKGGDGIKKGEMNSS